MILQPPSPFLDAKDLNTRYASQVRKLSNVVPVADGDPAFYKVDTRRPAHELEPGVAADAVNKRFEDGRAWARFGIAAQAWGTPPVVNTTGNLLAGLSWPFNPLGALAPMSINLVPGQSYVVTTGTGEIFRDQPLSATQTIQNGVPFIALQPTYYLVAGKNNTPVTSILYKYGQWNVCGFARFNDPQGFDVTLVATDDWRSASGEDGGRGRVWRILPGNAPVAVPMNGHDVWGTARLIPCFNGVAMLRQGNERHYFSATVTLPITGSNAAADTLTVNPATLSAGKPVTATGITGLSTAKFVGAITGTTISLYDTAAHAIAGGPTGRFNVTVDNQTGTLSVLAIDPAANTIQLNDPPTWNNSDKIIYNIIGGSNITGTKPPNPGAGYYVKNLPGNKIQLYSDAALSTQMTFNTAVGQFYFERAADFPGFYGNGAPPLLARPNASGNTWLDLGFTLVPTSILVTSTASSASASDPNVLTVPQHGLLPGDAVTTTGIHTTGGALIAGTVYAYPISPNALRLYTNATAAIAGGATSQVPLSVNGESGTLTQAGSTGQPMPSGREGLYFQNRFIVVNNSDTVMISDPLDPLHFSPFVSAVTANLGSSDPITALWPFGSDSVLIMRATRVDILQNLSGGPAAWTLTNVTTEYGCIAPLSVAQTGNDVWFLTRKGVASITQTEQGEVQGVADPVSSPMKKYVDQIDWNHAPAAVGEYWNNRYFVAVPLKGQTGAVINNGVLSHNFLNQGWEGLWQGATLTATGFARQLIGGDERLTFVNASGQVNWFTDGFTDGQTPIADSLLTRAYVAGAPGRKLWLQTAIIWDTYNPTLTVTAVTPGYNETLPLVTGQTYDLTTYQIQGQTAYDPASSTEDSFDKPYRADYTLTAQELMVGVLDVHQNYIEKYRMRRDDWAVQIRIENASGSARIQAVAVEGVPGPSAGTRNV